MTYAAALPQSEEACDRPPFIGVWEALPSDYNPVLPLADLSAPTLRIPTGLGLLMPLGGKLPPFRDPTILGHLVPDGLPTPADLLAGGTHYQDPYHPVSTVPWAVGVSTIGDPDVAIGWDPIPALHGRLSNADVAQLLYSPTPLPDSSSGSTTPVDSAVGSFIVGVSYIGAAA